MLVLVDYGMGNIRSVSKALEKVGFSPIITRDPDLILRADALVVPGVGAFKDAVSNLKNLGLFSAILRHIEKGKPYLGICLGLQLLFEKSYEFGEEKGFGILEGEVILLPPRVKVPHIGWNQIWKTKESLLLEGIKDGDYFYFVHSYHVVPKRREVIATLTDYGVEFVSSVEYQKIFGLQFHPEKSQKLGLKLLENFKRIVYG
ncbi:MAG: imidazole glycerol phosphate synthase subunit HisH [Hydrogenobacter thermophilus]|uniref:imidazole glycerol phosphate synthase subunit HisH n=1 Tax=Hydrogenobacter thermophilus TaxID=940 RepID=UPI001C7745ED|nr:imidazole glycerol phosphate synthase subunit HisH [Hydrogenobacter thermophilus]QWK19752.1 MAG: imidazole glycerol phosphate synthase subunit HisH [Hydrogenobacter thermophilus]